MHRYFLEDKGLLRRTLPPSHMRLLIRLLDSLGAPDQAASPDSPLPILQQVAVRLAQVILVIILFYSSTCT